MNKEVKHNYSTELTGTTDIFQYDIKDQLAIDVFSVLLFYVVSKDTDSVCFWSAV